MAAQKREAELSGVAGAVAGRDVRTKISNWNGCVPLMARSWSGREQFAGPGSVHLPQRCELVEPGDPVPLLHRVEVGSGDAGQQRGALLGQARVALASLPELRSQLLRESIGGHSVYIYDNGHDK